MSILKARSPKKTDIDLYSDIFVEAAEQVEATPPLQFKTLNVAEHTRVKGAASDLFLGLSKFFEQLADVDIHPDDDERTEAIARLAELTEIKLNSVDTILTRMARLAYLPKTAEGPEFRQLLQLIEKLPELEAKADPNDKPLFALMRKLAAIFI